MVSHQPIGKRRIAIPDFYGPGENIYVDQLGWQDAECLYKSQFDKDWPIHFLGHTYQHHLESRKLYERLYERR